jgi:hypothetical protein
MKNDPNPQDLLNIPRIEPLTCPHTHTHTTQHRTHDHQTQQSSLPTLKPNGKTTQNKKANKPKATSVVCNFTTPHPHKEKNKEIGWQINIKAT